MTPRLLLVLAFASGAPALVYQVAWTRQAGLAVGSQIEALAVVVAAFFGGLAAGAQVLGRAADAVRRPLLLYGALELAAGALVLLTVGTLPALGAPPWAAHTPGARLLLAALMITAITFLLGGTVPALLRSTRTSPLHAARAAGALVAANTAGAVAGVALAAAAIPLWGLRASLAAAAGVAIGLGIVAMALARRAPPLPPAARAGADEAPSTPGTPAPPAGAPDVASAASAAPGPGTGAPGNVPWRILALAFGAGVATLAFEVLATRAAALRLGSSLFAWAAVLALFLAGLALGNALTARRAVVTGTPWRLLGRLEAAAAATALAAALWLAPPPAHAAAGLTLPALLTVVLFVVPAAVLAGAAFPVLVRVGVRGQALGTAFGALSATNTAGGIAGSLLVPFVLLEPLDLAGGFVFVALVGGLVAGVALRRAARGAPLHRRSWGPATVGVVGGAALLWVLARVSTDPGPARLLFADDGPQASAAVVWRDGGRHLFVDGDPEAANVGNPRRTEELLALLPLALRPGAEELVEVGLGSGITLGTAARTAASARVDCVEIAGSVMRAARLFGPENGEVTTAPRPGVRVLHGDGRAFLATRRARYDVALLNTVQPWSVGSTGLYSRDYFERVRGALRPGGLAAQWLPATGIDAPALEALLRTFFTVFPEGGVWWGFEDLVLVGAGAGTTLPATELPKAVAAGLRRLGIGDRGELRRRRIAPAAAAREALGPGRILEDDRPWLEAASAVARPRRGATLGTPWALLERLARAGARSDPAAGAMLLWIQSRGARAAGDAKRADRLEGLAARAGLDLAAQWRRARWVREAAERLAQGGRAEAEARIRQVLQEDPDHSGAWALRARARFAAGDLPGARTALRRALAADPDRVDAWLLLAEILERLGDRDGTDAALARALEADPFAPPALGAAGLRAVQRGALERARELLARLEALDPRGTAPERRALSRALREAAQDAGAGPPAGAATTRG